MVRETRYLWVANLPDTVSEDQIAEYFGRQGSVFVCLVIVCDCRPQIVLSAFGCTSCYRSTSDILELLMYLDYRNSGISILKDISRLMRLD